MNGPYTWNFRLNPSKLTEFEVEMMMELLKKWPPSKGKGGHHFCHFGPETRGKRLSSSSRSGLGSTQRSTTAERPSAIYFNQGSAAPYDVHCGTEVFLKSAQGRLS